MQTVSDLNEQVFFNVQFAGAAILSQTLKPCNQRGWQQGDGLASYGFSLCVYHKMIKNEQLNGIFNQTRQIYVVH